jgi:hypothetical protein
LREIELVAGKLSATRGNPIKAAEFLGPNWNTLRKKLRILDIRSTFSPRRFGCQTGQALSAQSSIAGIMSVYNLAGGELEALQALKHRALYSSHPLIVSFFFASHSAFLSSHSALLE